jgi:hypothetical protein
MLVIISVSVLVNHAPQSFAEDYWRSPILKWNHQPTICALEPADSRFPNLADKMITETQNAILDWELKLNNNNLANNNPWSIPFTEIPLSHISTYDKTKCDITMNFKDKPDNVSTNSSFYESGVTDVQDFPKVSVTIFYQGAEFDIQHVAISQGVTEYVPVLNYNDYFATDTQLKSTIRHEIGHAIGLGHYVVSNDELNRIYQGLEDSPSIMVENGLVGIGVTHFDITQIDVSEVKSIYGNNGFPSIQKPIQVQNSNPVQIINTTQPQEPNSSTPTKISSNIPSWIKNTVKMWSQSQISDEEFANAMGYLAKQGILKMSNIVSNPSASHQIPAWIRSNADLWTSGQITDYEFLRGIEYMISVGITK